MASQTIEITTELPTTADRVWDAMQHPASFLYVTRGLLGFPALAGRTDPLRVGETGSGWILALHVVPLHRHTIDIVAADERTRTIVSHEHGGVLRRWEHTLHVEPVGDRTCRYSDTILVDAGVLTTVVAAIARAFYRYRQRRWHRLVHKHLMPEAPPR